MTQLLDHPYRTDWDVPVGEVTIYDEANKAFSVHPGTLADLAQPDDLIERLHTSMDLLVSVATRELDDVAEWMNFKVDLLNLRDSFRVAVDHLSSLALSRELRELIASARELRELSAPAREGTIIR